MQVSESELKEFILDSGLVPRKDVEAADEEAKKKKQSLGDILIAQGALSTDSLRRIKAYVLGIPFVNLKDRKIPLEVLSLIPEPIARTHSIVAFRKGEGELEVAMLDTEDLPAIDSVRKTTGLKIQARLTDEDSLKNVLLQYQKSLKEEFGDLISTEAGKINLIKDAVEGDETSGEDLKKMAEDLPIVRIVDTLLRHAIIQKASDIHIEPMEHEVLVRYRIDGVLHDAMTLPRTAAAGITARIKVLANLKLDEKRLPQDGRFKMETETDKVSFRVSMLPTYFGEKIVMRLLRETGEGFTLDVLGFHGDSMERIHKATKASTGLILISGPTGSGKTTTLYTILDILNTPDVNISTVEDPIEYQMKRVNQTQVNPAIGFTFANGLRSLVRQDPDVIMVGEIRDGETASLAINAALTGHLVLSTIHTNSAAGAIPRLMDMGVEPFLLVSTLRVIVGQRLVRRLCDGKEQYSLDAEERAKVAGTDKFDAVLKALTDEKLVKAGSGLDDVPFYKPTPSAQCEDGYSGRIGIHEVLSVTPTIRDLILHNGTTDAIEEQARKEGMLTMLEDGIYKATRGVTSIEEVLRAVTE
ncbi:Flp pilus assembly complex ATPase component TadA [Patescibacteria group bacterium]|nr:Flp pilus assembly complex ATPase component TadA [Patescibacteria group bacterium]MBU1500430.1 Flp pilus assembly complex ATPase component TadA [Patescibacteria group bacterium]MBU2080498.1 Flp pilus assembly complex ATPase component TadA [Patescibacteria group bacterium]MBU2123697.1 Flp pilus assembly complex ATPase component TadA [Patescibacteria group bacterium]MBU2194553.1 Flp pilus assembly complex ATPase component TadA [Patescibacteria group bacterium]